MTGPEPTEKPGIPGQNACGRALRLRSRVGTVGLSARRQSIDTSSHPDPERCGRREIIAALVDTAQGFAVIAKGLDDRTTLHNICAKARQAPGLSRNVSAKIAAEHVCVAARTLIEDRKEVAASVANGVYPPVAQRAAETLQRLREVALPR